MRIAWPGAAGTASELNAGRRLSVRFDAVHSGATLSGLKPTPALAQLFANNKAWSERIRKQNPDFFVRLARQQAPKYLWIGCADSRVPANEIVDMLPGEVFVHRNIANVVVHTDLNCLSVMEFAVEVLKVAHILVVGHYGCSGVNAALHRERIGLADNWLQHVQDVRRKHEQKLECVAGGPNAKHDRLCELNVIEQVANVCRTTIVRDAWLRGQELSVHGVIYGLHDGLLRDLQCSASNPNEAAQSCREAVNSL
jgi:carbonic anhydrase